MVKFLYATNNSGKIINMKNRLLGTEFEFVSLRDLSVKLDVDENGENEIQNAVMKAEAYSKLTDLPVLGADSGLYFDDESLESPGLYVHRKDGRDLSGENQVEYYMDLAKQNGGSIKAHFKTAFALKVNDKVCTGEVIEPSFLFLSERDMKNKNAKMMDSIEFSLLQNKYYSQMTDEEFRLEDKVFRDYIINFLRNCLKGQ